MVFRGRLGQVKRERWLIPRPTAEVLAMTPEEQKAWQIAQLEELRARAAAGKAAEEAAKRKGAAGAPSVMPIAAAAGGLALLWLLL